MAMRADNSNNFFLAHPGRDSVGLRARRRALLPTKTMLICLGGLYFRFGKDMFPGVNHKVGKPFVSFSLGAIILSLVGVGWFI